MRVLLTGDTQIGSGLDLGVGDYGPQSRLADQEATLDRIAAIADEENVDQVVHLGDVFERPTPPPWQVVVVQNWLRRLNRHVTLVLGNHDLKSPALPHVLSVLERDRVAVCDRPRVFDLGAAAAAALPWAPMNRLAAGESVSRADLKRRTVEALVLVAQRLRLEAGDGALLFGHWAVSGSTLPSGAAIEEMLDEPILPWSDADALGFRLVAFGHIHGPQVIGQGLASTPMIYVGSPAACNFGEASTPHGVWIWDDAGDGTLRFVEVPDRKFVTYQVDFFDGDDFSQLLEHYRADERGFDGAFVRLVYRCSEEHARHVNEAAIVRAAMEEGARRVFVKAKVERASRARVEIDDEQIDPTDALELWLRHNEPTVDADELRSEHARMVGRL